MIDEDGCYEPADFNDGLLFGTQGTWRKPSCMRVRLPGGKLNKAKKGELRFSPMMDLCYDAEGRIILDPDEEVRAQGLVFRLFGGSGSAFWIVQRFHELGLRFPGLWGRGMAG